MIRYTIEEGHIDDAGGCAALEAMYSYAPWKKDAFEQAAVNDSIFLTAKSGGSIIGCFLAFKVLDEGQIVTITVDEKYRNQAVGYSLLHRAVEIAGNAGISVFYLEVRMGNFPALHLYKKFGFEQLGIRRNFYTKPSEDAITMKFCVTAVN